ncbi:MAG: TonB-dependent receptor plug domain-containing protein, partial [Prevotella sp.]|nr:TonB-dependent receptor plug domain-containing protein [Prevotella sp.]
MKKIYIIALLHCICLSIFADTTAGKASLSGKVTDDIDKAPLVGVSIYFPELKEGTVTNENGDYSITGLPAVSTTIQVSYVGHQTIIRSVDLRKTNKMDFVMKEANAMINEVVVTGLTGTELLKNSPSPVSIVSPRELQMSASTNIIDAVAKQPGVAQITTGSGISKPVIRGLGFNRILVVNDGIRQEGQQWGDEHGIEIDAQRVHSVEILKGPASLVYGSDAMAGVLIFHDEPVMAKGTMAGEVESEYQTNNGLFDYSAEFAGNQGGLVWNWRWSEKMAHDYKNPYDG